jgi:hypothetical protein
MSYSAMIDLARVWFPHSAVLLLFNSATARAYLDHSYPVTGTFKLLPPMDADRIWSPTGSNR